MDEKARDQAAAAVKAYNARVRAIRADDSLSEKGKHDALEAEFKKAQATTSKLRDDSAQTAESRRQALRRELFGLSYGSSDAEVVSMRDAQDRVAQAGGSEKLGDLMDQATVTGDRSLLRAGFARAWQQGRNPMSPAGAAKWNGLVDEYVRQNPSVKGPLEELEQLNSSASRTAQTLESMMTQPKAPDELGRPSW